MDTVTTQTAAAAWPAVGLVAGAICCGLAVAILVAQLLRVIWRNPHQNAALPSMRGERLQALRRGNAVFRRLEPFALELAQLPLASTIARGWHLQKRLDSGASSLPWRPEELLAVWTIRGILFGVGGVVATQAFLAAPASLVLFVCIVVACTFHQKLKFDKHATRRLTLLQQRLPYAVDLMALMMEAGAGFKESFATVVREIRGQPLGDEFGKVLKEIECGQTLAVALQRLATRLRVEDISEVILAVQTAEELGTPLSETFLDLAERMRNKRSLWAEKRAGEAKASITFPGIVIMVACLVIVVAPFVLQAVYEAQVF